MEKQTDTHGRLCPPYLEYQHTHVWNSQINFCALTIRREVKPDAIHLQFPSNFKHLKVWFGRSLAPVIRKKKKLLRSVGFYSAAHVAKMLHL